jgi:hypothetical protein
MYYYKAAVVNPVSSKEMVGYNTSGKYFILHQGSEAYQLSGVIISNEILNGNLTILPENRYKFRTTRTDKSNRYRNSTYRDETYVLNEVHLYLTDSVTRKLTAGTSVRLGMTEIARAEEYQKNKGKTSASWILPPASVIGLLILMEVAESLSTQPANK